MGRPKGSKNKSKTDVVSTVDASTLPEPLVKKKAKPAVKEEVAPAPAPVEEPVKKQRGRPKGWKKDTGAKVVVPVIEVPKVKAVVPPAEVVREPVEEAPIPTSICEVPKFSLDDLKHPALDGLEKSITEIANLASARRRIHHESRSLPGISYTRSILKTLIDYFEVDVKKYIAGSTKKA